MSEKKKHRGRIQAQGGGLEASEKWAQDEPLSHKQGQKLLQNLKKKIPKKEYQLREEQFDKMGKLIDRIGEQGGVEAHFSKSYKKKGTEDIRVDVEVLGGKAFVTLLLIIIFLIWMFK